jgi:hypothetical protein
MSNTKSSDEANWRREADKRTEKRSDDMKRTRDIERKVGRHAGYKQSGAGKGDLRRTGEDTAAFERNFDNIIWKKSTEFCEECGHWTCVCEPSVRGEEV